MDGTGAFRLFHFLSLLLFFPHSHADPPLSALWQIRHGFYIILFLFLISLPILWKVDMVKGSADAERYERETRQVRAEGTTEGEAEGLLAGEQG